MKMNKNTSDCSKEECFSLTLADCRSTPKCLRSSSFSSKADCNRACTDDNSVHL